MPMRRLDTHPGVFISIHPDILTNAILDPYLERIIEPVPDMLNAIDDLRLVV